MRRAGAARSHPWRAILPDASVHAELSLELPVSAQDPDPDLLALLDLLEDLGEVARPLDRDDLPRRLAEARVDLAPELGDDVVRLDADPRGRATRGDAH